MSAARRLEASIVASALLHALVLGTVLRGGRVTLRPPLIAIPVALVARPGGGGGVASASAAAAASEPAPAPAPASPTAPQATPRARTAAVARRPPPTPVLPPESTAPAGGGASDGVAAASGGGGGDGSGGDGSGGARVAYGTNPLPPYPLVARRLGKEGVVLLAVVVAPDGRAADVRVLRSSGFAPLDDSAVTTVRERWRFIPARRDGAPIESRVTVPIRFRLAGEAG
jgi:periplasmic protein TonB